MTKVRVRLAPSPTGYMHIGTARTALFNWLYARHTGGTFILRIEDTDTARHVEDAVQAIYKGLEWLGLDWDEGPLKGGEFGPYFQSQRKDIYKKYVQRLLDEKFAYEDQGAIRFRIPKTKITVSDMVCGDVEFDRAQDPDLVIVRSNGEPVFHLVNVVDDIEMRITHVIRGEDHLSNTPKHIELFRALGVEPPRYAHIPLILNPEGGKMSKRDTGASVTAYMEEGLIPEAVRNYLCLLGWSPKSDQEIFAVEEVIARFDIPQINRRNAAFDYQKLLWMNSYYLHRMSPERMMELSAPWFSKAGRDLSQFDENYIKGIFRISREKVNSLKELPEYTSFFLTEDFPVDETAAAKDFVPEKVGRLDRLREHWAALPEFSATVLESALKQLAGELGVKAGELIHPARLAVSGRTIGPSLYHMLEVLGRERVHSRLQKVVEKYGK